MTWIHGQQLGSTGLVAGLKLVRDRLEAVIGEYKEEVDRIRRASLPK